MSGAWPDYIQAMRRSLPLSISGTVPPEPWYLLPTWCCQGAGGEADLADGVAAAWLLFHLAADIFDTVEDQDPPDAWLQELGPAGGLNVGCGLFFTACLALNEYADVPATRAAADSLQAEFHKQMLAMSSSQHRDLTLAEIGLEQYWQIAAGKSGAFYGLACWAGARLGTDQPECLDGFRQYGYHFGLLMQILDDFHDIKVSRLTSDPGLQDLRRSFAMAYALEVLPGEQRREFLETIELVSNDPGALQAAMDLINRDGADLYLALELERQRSLALAGLERAQPTAEIMQILTQCLPDLQDDLSNPAPESPA